MKQKKDATYLKITVNMSYEPACKCINICTIKFTKKAQN